MSFITFCLALAALASVEGLVAKLLSNRKEVRLKELEVQKLEALAKLKDQRLIGELPAWVDPDSPSEIEAWREAQKEVARTQLAVR